MNGAEDRFERLVTAVPGPQSRERLAALRRVEPRGVTYAGDAYPVVWESGCDALVRDVDGNRYIDLTSAFGVANIGHGNAHVAAAVARQAALLAHGMGDVHPPAVKIALLEKLAALAPGDLQQTYLTTGGAEAIEFALKTALLATGKSRFVAYRGAYHGLSLGTLDVIGIPKFREPFAALIGARTTWLTYPDAACALDIALADVESALRAGDIAALIVEPIQGRGGVIVPPAGYLRGLRALCDAAGALLIFDEIYTGFGRTGWWFACQREAVIPDLLCIGKALGGGMPIGAAVGTPAVMDAWPASTGEALHTATFLGNPVVCAAALAALEELERRDLVARTRARGPALGERIARFTRHADVVAVRGTGFLWALEFADAATANAVVVDALARGVVVLQSGPTGTSITIAPPLMIADDQLAHALDILDACIAAREIVRTDA